MDANLFLMDRESDTQDRRVAFVCDGDIYLICLPIESLVLEDIEIFAISEGFDEKKTALLLRHFANEKSQVERFRGLIMSIPEDDPE